MVPIRLKFGNLFKVAASVFIIIAIFQCCQRNKAITKPVNPVPDSTIYSFINAVIKDNEKHPFPPFKLIADRKTFGPEYSSQDSVEMLNYGHLLSKQDIHFIKIQLKTAYDFRVNPKYLPGKIIIPSDSINAIKKALVFQNFWSAFRNKYGSVSFWEISMPLFSKDKKTAIIQLGNHCGGLCGGGAVYIYQKTKGNWILIKTIGQWDS